MDVIIVAGGEGRRMGGVDKASLKLNGIRFIDHLLQDLAGIPTYKVIVVTPREDLKLGENVLRCSEEPPLGGPVAGIEAAMKLCSADYVAVIAVDAPYSARALAPLEEKLLGHPHASAAAIESEGFLQPLCAVWKRVDLLGALGAVAEAAGGSVRNQSVRAVLRNAPGEVLSVPATGVERDVDTPADLEAIQQP